jgi:hypothetical protein
MRPLKQVIRIERDQRALVVGRTGSGKSELVRALLADEKWIAVVDPKRDFWLPDEVEVDSPADFRRALDEQVRAEPYKPIVYRPTPELLMDSGAYDAIFRAVWERKNTRLYVDEVYRVLRGMQATPYYNALITQGRGLGISVIQSSQRPARIPVELLSESEHYIMFELRWEDDVDRMASLMGEAVEEPLTTEYSFYYHYIRRPGVNTYQLERPYRAAQPQAAQEVSIA